MSNIPNGNIGHFSLNKHLIIYICVTLIHSVFSSKMNCIYFIFKNMFQIYYVICISISGTVTSLLNMKSYFLFCNNGKSKYPFW